MSHPRIIRLDSQCQRVWRQERNAFESGIVFPNLDSLPIPQSVRLIKIDAEGHDLQVLQGAQRLTKRDGPIVIVEGWESGAVAKWRSERQYSIQKRMGSPNIVG